MVDRSPKGHLEIAGEGIEYTWANAKYYLRTVRLALATNKGARLSCNKIQRFSARARDYIGGHHYLQN
eukprot:5952686-Ditylum_brightwellii.AAC.1